MSLILARTPIAVKRQICLNPMCESGFFRQNRIRKAEPEGSALKSEGLIEPGSGRYACVRPADAQGSEASGLAELYVSVSKENMSGLGGLEQRLVVSEDDLC